MNDFMRTFVRGNVWRCRMSNGAVFEWWTPYKVKRSQARIELLVFANGDYEDVYTKQNIESLWETKGIREAVQS